MFSSSGPHRIVFGAIFCFLCEELGASFLERSTRTRPVIQAPVTAIAVSPSPEACLGRPGPGWQVVGPQFVASVVLRGGRAAWLCLQRDPAADSVVVGLGFLLEPHSRQAGPVKKVPRALSQGLARKLPVLTLPDGDKPGNVCHELGADFIAAPGYFEPAAHPRGNRRVHLCVQVQSRLGDSKAQTKPVPALLDISSISIRTGHNSTCATAALHGYEGYEVFALPGFDLESLVEDTPMLCLQHGTSSHDGLDKNIETSGHDFQASPKVVFNSTKRLDFPDMELAVSQDFGLRSREHVFVLGPESSATRLWSHLVASGLYLTTDMFEGFRYDKDSAVFHLSLPWGSVCGQVTQVPTYLDFGGTAQAYSYLPLASSPVLTNGLVERFNVDPSSLVMRHRERGDRIRVVLVVRDPRASLWGKQVEHCARPDLAAAEQSKAFELMLKAHRAMLPEITVVCFENMLHGGQSYIARKLYSMAIAPREIPEIANENAKYNLQDDDSLCMADMAAYAELCPDSPLAASFQKRCSR